MSIGDGFPEEMKREYAARNLKIGSVLKLHVKDTNPPKEKRFIVVGKTIDGICLATVYINSSMNKNVHYSEELQKLQLFLEADGREYLDHDSYVDCSTLYIKQYPALLHDFSSKPEALIGVLRDEDLLNVRNTIISSPKIKGKDKKRYGLY
ncbi:MAG: hypothetical protein ACOYOE_11945 [Chlorobium sp.]